MSESKTIEDISDLTPDPHNVNAGTERGLYVLDDSLSEVGAGRSIVADRGGVVLAGNKTLQVAADQGFPVRVVQTDGTELVVVQRTDLDLSGEDAERKRAQRLALYDNRAGQLGLEWDMEGMAGLFAEDEDVFEGLFQDWELEEMWPQDGPPVDPEAQLDKAAELQEKWQVEREQVWQCGEHFVICGDCREHTTWGKLLDAAGVERVNGVFTSPPYAEQRKKQYGGVSVAEYVGWWEAVQENVRAHLAADGSFFVNIKPHCEKGERVLYVFDLILAMKRRWGWRFVDELCWTHTGYMGGFPNRFKNQFEPVYHFCTNGKIKFRPAQVSHLSSGLPNGDKIKNSTGSGYIHVTKTKSGMARPGNHLPITPEYQADSHAAAFPVALPDFFIRAYSDSSDVWLDPFLGSGTTIVAAHNNERRGLGIEKLEKYVAVTLERLAGMGLEPVNLT